jgi:hypothetical protein
MLTWTIPPDPNDFKPVFIAGGQLGLDKNATKGGGACLVAYGLTNRLILFASATYASLDQAVQLVATTVAELGQISSLVEDLDSRVADQYSLTDVQIDDVSRFESYRRVTLTSPRSSWSSCLQLPTRRTFPSKRGDWLHLPRFGVYKRALQFMGACYFVSDGVSDVWNWLLITLPLFPENCEALLLLVRCVLVVGIYMN